VRISGGPAKPLLLCKTFTKVLPLFYDCGALLKECVSAPGVGMFHLAPLHLSDLRILILLPFVLGIFALLWILWNFFQQGRKK